MVDVVDELRLLPLRHHHHAVVISSHRRSRDFRCGRGREGALIGVVWFEGWLIKALNLVEI